MAKAKKRPAKKSAKARAKGARKKTVKKAAKKSSRVKAKGAAKKKVSKPSSPSQTGASPVKKSVKPGLDEEPKKAISSKLPPAAEPKEADLEDEEMGDDEMGISGEGEIDEDMEEDLPLDNDEEDVDYIEKSEDLLDDSDDYRTH